MKSHYFFIRGLRKEPFVTVCLIEWNNKMVARGVSICSKKEPPIKKEGQRISFERATQAIADYMLDKKSDHDMGINSDKAIESIAWFMGLDKTEIYKKFPYDTKSEILPIDKLLENEKAIIYLYYTMK